MTSGGVLRSQPLHNQQLDKGRERATASTSLLGLFGAMADQKRPSGEGPRLLCSRASQQGATRDAEASVDAPTEAVVAGSMDSKKRARTKSVSPRALRCLGQHNLGLDGWWPLMLSELLGSTRCPNADRLQTMSSGKMEGFGSNYRLPNLLSQRPAALKKEFVCDGCPTKLLADSGAVAVRAAPAA